VKVGRVARKREREREKERERERERERENFLFCCCVVVGVDKFDSFDSFPRDGDVMSDK